MPVRTAPPTAQGLIRLALAVPDFDAGTLQLVWPAEGPVISAFGHRRSGWHGGIDIKAPLGTPVQAAAPGVVVAAGSEARYGLVVKIEHAFNALTSGQFRIGQVSDNLGFKVQSHFTRFFREHTGITPNRYRQVTQVLE